MPYTVKVGVVLLVTPEIEKLLAVLDPIYQLEKVPLVITSGIEGAHRENSLHYRARAFDTRSRHMTARKRKKIHDTARRAFVESGVPGHLFPEPDHDHWEWRGVA